MKFKLKDVVIPTVSLFIICAVSAAALALSDSVTADKIAQNQAEKSAEAMKEVLLADEYDEITVDSSENASFYSAERDGKTVGYVASCSKTGYGGAVNVMVGIDAEGKVTAVKVVSCDDETPGLGQNVKTDEFQSRFKGISGEAVFGENVDAWTGATISSTAVKDAVNQAFALYNQYK